MSLITDVADAVASELNNGCFSSNFTAKRVALPRTDLKTLSDLTVSVIPSRVDVSISTRGMMEYRLTVHVGVQKKVSDETADVASLGDLVDEIVYFLTGKELSQCPGVIWRGIQNNPVYSADHLTQHRTFTSVISVEYICFQTM